MSGKRYEVRSGYEGRVWCYSLWDTLTNKEVRVNHWEYGAFKKRCDELNAEHETAKK